jgi:hypothetical protein
VDRELAKYTKKQINETKSAPKSRIQQGNSNKSAEEKGKDQGEKGRF